MYPTAEATRARTPRKTDHSLVLAVTTLSGLALVLLALQLTPAGPSDTGSASRGFKMPTVQFRPNQTTAEGSTPAPRGRVRTAATTPVIEQVVSPEATSSNDTAAVDTTLGDIPGIPPVIAPETTAVVETPQANRMTTRHDTPPTATKLREPSHRVPARSGSEVRPAVAVAAPVIKDDTDWPLLCGVVTDAAGQPIPGARVTATEIALSMRTDTKGRFCLSAPAGTQHLLIEAAGFTQTREAVQISAGLPELRLTLAR
jgi:hypothetical protein